MVAPARGVPEPEPDDDEDAPPSGRRGCIKKLCKIPSSRSVHSNSHAIADAAPKPDLLPLFMELRRARIGPAAEDVGVADLVAMAANAVAVASLETMALTSESAGETTAGSTDDDDDDINAPNSHPNPNPLAFDVAMAGVEGMIGVVAPETEAEDDEPPALLLLPHANVLVEEQLELQPPPPVLGPLLPGPRWNGNGNGPLPLLE